MALRTRNVALHPVRFDVREVLTVHPRRLDSHDFSRAHLAEIPFEESRRRAERVAFHRVPGYRAHDGGPAVGAEFEKIAAIEAEKLLQFP
jgi:hypothetical protein